MSLNYDELHSFVKDNYIDTGVLNDSIFEMSNLLKYIKANMTDKAHGGRNLVISPILYAKTAAHGSVSGFGDVDINPNNKWTAAEYEWKTLYSSLAMSFDERDAMVANNVAVANWVDKEVMAAKMTLADDLSIALFNDGSDSDSPHGLRKIVDVDRTLGGINSTNYSWWDSYVDDDTSNYTAANLVNPTSPYYCLKALRKLDRGARHNNDFADVGVITGGWHDILNEELQPITRYGTSDIRKAEFDFADFAYKGRTPLIEDDIATEHVPGYLFFLNKNWFKLYIHMNRDFLLGPFQEPVNKLTGTIVAQISVKSQFASNGPRMLGRIRAAAAVG